MYAGVIMGTLMYTRIHRGIPLTLHDVFMHKGPFVTNNTSHHEPIFSRSSNKDNMHWKRIHISMEEEWWKSEETDQAAADDSGSNMNDEPLRPQPDKDFEADPPLSVISFFVTLLMFGLPAIGIPWFLSSNNAPTPVVVCCGIPIGLLGILTLRSGLSKRRLRVQHSIDRLVYEHSFFGRVHYFEDRPLSESAYLEYTKTQNRFTDEEGTTRTRTSRNFIIHGNSSEEGEWEISVGTLIRQSGNYRRKAGEIADAIGIEFRG